MMNFEQLYSINKHPLHCYHRAADRDYKYQYSCESIESGSAVVKM